MMKQTTTLTLLRYTTVIWKLMDCYVAIEDLMQHMISSQHVYVSTRKESTH